MADSRGVRRGSCMLCGCDSYDGGDSGKKCLGCSHRPGQHKNLDKKTSITATIVEQMVAEDEQAVVSMPHEDVSFELAPDTVEKSPIVEKQLYATRSSELEDGLVIEDVEDSPFGSEDSKTIAVANSCIKVSRSSKQCDESSSEPFSVSSVTSSYDILPDGERCCLPGCNRPRYRDKDRIHPFCGRYHAKLYQQKSQAVDLDTQELCKTPGCKNFRYRDQSGKTFDYCSRFCRDNQPADGLTVTMLLSDEELGECSLPDCDKTRYQDPANGRIHPFCTRSHASKAKLMGISVPESDSTIKLVDLSSNIGQAVSATFNSTWAPQKGSCPSISFIFSVVNVNLRKTWRQYQDTLSITKVHEYFHGTTLECNITVQQTLCSNTDCGVCGIANTGFDRRCIRKNIDFQRFGHGFYVAPNSSKCHDYTRGKHGYRAMILFDVCPGNKYELQRDDETLTEPPSGYNSVHGKAGFSLNYDELVLYNPDGAFPKYIIVYQRDGEQRIAANLKSTIRKSN